MYSTAFNTKIQAMRKHSLTRADYENLSRLKSVDEIGRKIREFEGYRGIFGETSEEEETHRMPLERNLVLSLLLDYKKLISFATDYTIKAHIDAFFMSNEIKIIKLIMGIVRDQTTHGYTADDFKPQITGKSPVDVDKLFASRRLDEFVENLRGTVYYAPLSRAYSAEATMFELEAQLDIFYYMHLWKQRQKLGRNERRAVERVIGTQIDLRNIMWVYRFKRYYNVAPELMYSSIIPVTYRVKSAQMNNLVEHRNMPNQDVLSQGLCAPYNDIFKEYTTLEYDYYQKMLNVFRTAEKDGKSSVVRALSYLFSKELEITNLTTLIECIRYSLTPEETMKRLYLLEEGDAV
ncbi:hypothetical protein FACS1894188_00530 [Clostridia bacterium]|nr:hypothetical protein FACS1894188_00530 [Clostridia bacterium]